MQSFYRLGDNRSARFLIRNMGVYLIYAALLVRSLLMTERGPAYLRTTGLLGLYGVLLVAAHWLEKRPHWLKVAYLLAQIAILLNLQGQTYKQDFYAILFIPLGLQAVLFFGRRMGYAWIAVFAVLTTVSVLNSWQWDRAAFPTAVLYIGALIFIASYAHLIIKAEAARRKNQGLLVELQSTYEQVQAYAVQAQAYAALNERSRMARELHDSATQTIFSMNLAVQAAQLLAEKNPPKMIEQLDQLQELAQSAVREIQALSAQLSTPLVAESHLPLALRRLAAERQQRDGLEISVEIEGERPLDEHVAGGLYHIAQEALTNIAKHAGSKQARLHLYLKEPPACLEIADQGAGFQVDNTRQQAGHLGLQSMAERASEIGWKLSLDSSPGQGTQIRVEEVCA